MALITTHGETTFGIGDTITVTHSIVEGGKERLQVFEGIVIAIRGEKESKSFIVRRIGFGQIGIEKIFPLHSPIIKNIKVKREGREGVRRAKLYYIEDLPKREIEKIYQRAAGKNVVTKKVKKATKRVKAGTKKSKRTRKPAKSKARAK